MPFSANAKDLEEAIGYDLAAIEYVRTTLYRQDETAGLNTTFTLGDTLPDGTQIQTCGLMASFSQSEAAVHAALDRVRPLAFGAAFKIHDMIVGWVLNANGKTAWPFRKKIEGYDALRAAGTLLQPSLFISQPIVANAFWELYRDFVPYRNAATHSGAVTLSADNSIEIVAASGTLVLSPAEQASYMRAMCLLAEIFAGHVQHDSFHELLVHSDLLRLEPHHKQKGLLVRNVHRGHASINVPSSHVTDRASLAFEVDFGHVSRTIGRACGAGPDDVVCFSADLIVQADTDTKAIWSLPLGTPPTGIVTVKRGDPHFDPYLQIVAT
jgi:hypothetical protein